MTDWGTINYSALNKTQLIDLLHSRDQSHLSLDRSQDSNIPSGAKQINPNTRKLQQYNGTSWNDFDLKIQALTDLQATVNELTDITSAQNGKWRISSNLMIQWGFYGSTTDGIEHFTFGEAFTNRCFNVQTTRLGSNATSVLALINTPTKTGFSVNRDDNLQSTQQFFMLAIGD